MQSEEPKTQTPGLYRGIQVMHLLEKQDVGLTLKELSDQIGYPKASLLRILETLVVSGVAERREGLYRAVVRMVPVLGLADGFTVQLKAALRELAETTGVTAEWFIPSPEGMLLIERYSDPQAELVVLARVGFCRKWNDELDSVIMQGYRFWKASPRLADEAELWVYDSAGQRLPIGSAKAVERIAKIKPGQIAEDYNVNTNGVLRMAGAVMRGQEFLGALSLAMPRLPQFDERKTQHKSVLQNAVNQLSQPERNP